MVVLSFSLDPVKEAKRRSMVLMKQSDALELKDLEKTLGTMAPGENPMSSL